MAKNNNKSFVETMVDAQKQMVDTMVENSKKIANGNTMMKETVEKGSDWYKNWLDNQHTVFAKAKDKAENVSENSQNAMNQMNGFYQDWFNTQMNWAKQMWEMNMDFAKQTASKNTVNNNDPMAMWNNWTNNWNGWMNNMSQAAQWNDMMKNMQNNNPFSADAWKTATDNWTNMFNQYYQMLNNSFAEMQKNMQNGTTEDAYRNMVNVSEGFTRFAEIWMPFWKSIQEKTFNTEMFSQMMKPDAYKELMDKFFGFMPEQSREYFQKMTEMAKGQYSQMNQAATDNYNQMRNSMNAMMPSSAEMFGGMMNNYNAFYNMMNSAAAPFTKMMTPNQHTKAMTEWADISNRMAVYSIKNAELQYMVYNQGGKVMEALAENIAKKVEKGEEVTSIMALYQEWLNLGDSTFVELFESEEYSKLMAEVNAMQLKLRKDVEGQMEKFMVGIPVATRSEMDELYKTIYDLKKEVRDLEKQVKATKTTTTASKASATSTVKSAPAKKAAKPIVKKAAPTRKSAASRSKK